MAVNWKFWKRKKPDNKIRLEIQVEGTKDVIELCELIDKLDGSLDRAATMGDKLAEALESAWKAHKELNINMIMMSDLSGPEFEERVSAALEREMR